MSIKAVDIVLLPEEATLQYIVDMHKNLDNGNKKQKIDLVQACLPHLSLVMGGLNDKDPSSLFKITESVAKEIERIDLNFSHITQHQNPKGECINSLAHKQSASLYVLHEKLVYQTRKLLANKVDSQYFFGEGNVNKDSINWVNDYFTAHSLENFSPHITLGTGIYTGDFQIFSASFKRLAICHLGNYCTCRKILFETQLSG